MLLDNFPVQRDFFSVVGQLGMKRHAEDQLTNVFKACFTHSTVFQKAVLQKLWTLCGIGTIPPRSTRWNCATQITDGDSRYDIYISPEQVHRTQSKAPCFIIESKLAAPLTSTQLGKYFKRNRDQEHCIAVITKEHPQVTQAWLKKHGVASLRWQDVYQVLQEVSRVGRQLDRFLITQFLHYLSRADMAYEAVTRTHLHDFSRLLTAISRGRRDGVVNRGRKAFSTGDAVLRLLKEVQVVAEEQLRNPRVFKVWGPGYDKFDDDDGAWHGLYFSFYKGHRSINCGIWFSDGAKQKVFVDISYWSDKSQDHFMMPYCWQPVERFLRNGALDKDRILNECRTLFRRWSIAKHT